MHERKLTVNMASIKGPKSALTDFIEEHGIVIDKNPNYKKIKESVPKQPKNNSNKRVKRVKRSKPREIINIEDKLLRDRLVEKIIENISDYKLKDRHLKMVAAYISRKRIYDMDLVKYIMKHSCRELVLYDCSMIKDEEYDIKYDLEILELHSCGQLTNEKINCILKKMKDLKTLKLTGGYLLTELDLPSSLIILDLSHCSRMNNYIIHEINKKYKILEELRLSYCYKLQDMEIITRIERLHLNETNFSIDSIKYIEEVKELSLSRCPNINELNINFNFLEYLDIEGIPTIKEIRLKNRLKYLNCKQCFDLKIKIDDKSIKPWIYKQTELENLNLSYLDIDINFFKNMKKNRNLKILDISWCRNVDDELIYYLLDNFYLKKLYVFGCFDLSEEIAKKAWSHKNSVKIIGNPAETKYLIQNM